MLHPTLFPAERFATVDDVADTIKRGYLMAYRGHTLHGYETDLRIWQKWCTEHGMRLLDVKRVDIETYMREMEDDGLKPSTRQRRLVAIGGFYRYGEEEDLIAKSPARYVRKPRVPNVSTSNYLDRYELGRFLNAADALSERHAALACLLALNGLRVSEAVEANSGGLAFANGHRTLSIVRKGGKEAEVPLAPRTFRAVLRCVGDRCEGPLVLDSHGNRMSRYSAAKAVRRVARRAEITKKIGPHSLRHTFVSLGLAAGVELRTMQTAVGHADVSTTVRYDRRDHDLDHHAAYVVAAFLGSS